MLSVPPVSLHSIFPLLGFKLLDINKGVAFGHEKKKKKITSLFFVS